MSPVTHLTISAYFQNSVARLTFDFVLQLALPRTALHIPPRQRSKNKTQRTKLFFSCISPFFICAKAEFKTQTNCSLLSALCLLNYNGILTLSCIISTNASSDIDSCFSIPRRRSVTFLSAISFSPTTAIIGVFANDNSRIL